MSVVQIMVTIIIVTILVTVILGVVSYAAYWLRRVRRPVQAPVDLEKPRFFFRYAPSRPSPDREVVSDFETSGDESRLASAET